MCWWMPALMVTLGVLGPRAVQAQAEDPLQEMQWGLETLEFDDAHRHSTGEGVVMAVLDTGVDLDHPDLVDKLVPDWDFVENDDQPRDENGLGTHIAGIAAASSDNAAGVIGAAPDALSMPVRVLDRRGGGRRPESLPTLHPHPESPHDVRG